MVTERKEHQRQSGLQMWSTEIERDEEEDTETGDGSGSSALIGRSNRATDKNNRTNQERVVARKRGSKKTFIDTRMSTGKGEN